MREKKIEAAKRTSDLQKARELKQVAGIDIYKPLKALGVDYGAEIPFAKHVPVGRYEADTNETPDNDLFKSNISI
jgi:hypothetical protein